MRLVSLVVDSGAGVALALVMRSILGFFAFWVNCDGDLDRVSMIYHPLGTSEHHVSSASPV